MPDLLDDVLEAWTIHNDINLFILDWLPPAGLGAVTLLKTGKPSTGRNVARIFAHMHEVRRSRLSGRSDLPRFESVETPSAMELREALDASGRAVAEVLRAAVVEGKPVKGWKRPAVTWLTYLISHESHHRGQIAQALKQSGVRPPDEVAYGVWGYWNGYPLKQPG